MSDMLTRLVSSPQLHSVLTFVGDFPSDLRAFLGSRGHLVVNFTSGIIMSVVQGIYVSNQGNVSAYSDARKEATPPTATPPTVTIPPPTGH